MAYLEGWITSKQAIAPTAACDPAVPGRRNCSRYLPRLRIVACAALFAGLTILYSRQIPSVDNEMFNLYAGARIGPRGLYNPENFRQVAASLGAKVMEARLYYCRMPYFAVLTKPLGWFTAGAALAIWRVLMSLALAIAVFLWPGPGRTMGMVALVSLPVVWTIGLAQDVALVLLFVSACVVLLRKRRRFAAGAVFSLCLGKPHLVVFVPAVMLARRDYGFLLGAAAGAALQIALSFAVAGPAWPLQWLGILANSRMHPFVEAMPGLRALSATSHGAVVASVIVISLLAAVWRLATSLPIERTIALALAAGLLANLHSYAVDCSLLVPAIAFALRFGRLPERMTGAVLASPFPYLAMTSGHPIFLQAGILALVHLPVVVQLARRRMPALRVAATRLAGVR